MKKTLLTLTLSAFALFASAQVPTACPTNIQLSSNFLTLTYSPSLPNGGFIDQVNVKLLNGGWKTLSLHSQTSNTITFNNQNARLLSSDIVESIRLIRSGQAVARCTQNLQLPVDFISHNAYSSNGETVVNFSIANEVDILEYRVLSIDGSVLASIPSNGSSEYTIKYNESNSSSYYIRVMGYDLSGDHSYTSYFNVDFNSNEIIKTIYMSLNGAMLDEPIKNCVRFDYYLNKVEKTYIIK